MSAKNKCHYCYVELENPTPQCKTCGNYTCEKCGDHDKSTGKFQCTHCTTSLAKNICTVCGKGAAQHECVVCKQKVHNFGCSTVHEESGKHTCNKCMNMDSDHDEDRTQTQLECEDDTKHVTPGSEDEKDDLDSTTPAGQPQEEQSKTQDDTPADQPLEEQSETPDDHCSICNNRAQPSTKLTEDPLRCSTCNRVVCHSESCSRGTNNPAADSSSQLEAPLIITCYDCFKDTTDKNTCYK